MNSTDRLKSIPPVAVLETGELVGSPEPMSVDEEVAGPHDKGRDAVIKAEENEEEKDHTKTIHGISPRSIRMYHCHCLYHLLLQNYHWTWFMSKVLYCQSQQAEKLKVDVHLYKI